MSGDQVGNDPGRPRSNPFPPSGSETAIELLWTKARPLPSAVTAGSVLKPAKFVACSNPLPSGNIENSWKAPGLDQKILPFRCATGGWPATPVGADVFVAAVCGGAPGSCAGTSTRNAVPRSAGCTT